MSASQKDWIQDAVIARAAELGMNGEAISQASGGKVSGDHVYAYLSKRKSMGSHKLQHVIRALGGGIDWKPRSTSRSDP